MTFTINKNLVFIDSMQFMNSSPDALDVLDDKLPDRCQFFSSLKDECINEKDYLHAIDVWIMFKMKTMGDYHALYMKNRRFIIS